MERKTPAEREQEAAEKEQAFHETGQLNAIGGYIGCDGPQCWALVQRIKDANFGNKIQGV